MNTEQKEKAKTLERYFGSRVSHVTSAVKAYKRKDLKKLRTQLQLTSKDMAQILGVSRTTYYRYEAQDQDEELSFPICCAIYYLKRSFTV